MPQGTKRRQRFAAQRFSQDHRHRTGINRPVYRRTHKTCNQNGPRDPCPHVISKTPKTASKNTLKFVGTWTFEAFQNRNNQGQHIIAHQPPQGEKNLFGPPCGAARWGWRQDGILRIFVQSEAPKKRVVKPNFWENLRLVSKLRLKIWPKASCFDLRVQTVAMPHGLRVAMLRQWQPFSPGDSFQETNVDQPWQRWNLVRFRCPVLFRLLCHLPNMGEKKEKTVAGSRRSHL